MRKVDLGFTLSIIANLGVIAGIVFLAFELRQNNELLGIELRNSARDRQVSTVDIVLNNSDVDLLGLLSRPTEQIPADDRTVLVLLGIRLLIVYEQAFEEVQSGLRDEADTIRLLRSVYERPVLNYGAPLAWETYRERATRDFVEWMEEKIIPVE